MSGTVTKVSGPLVVATGMADANISDVVRVGKQRLIGEILNMTGDSASIQVYEETSGLGPGEPVESMEVPLSVELGPGLIASIYDGIQRPLDDIMKVSGNNLKRGVEVPSLKLPEGWIVGTVGAGDAFCSGVLYAAWKGMDLKAAIELATASAACSLSAAGATEGMRPVEEVLKLYEEMR